MTDTADLIGSPQGQAPTADLHETGAAPIAASTPEANQFTWAGEFSSPELERRYQAQTWNDTRARTGLVVAIAVLAVLSGAFVDYALDGFGELFWRGSIVRGLVAVVMCAPLLAIRADWDRRSFFYAVFVCEFAFYCLVCFSPLNQQYPASVPFMSGTFGLVVNYIFIPGRLRFTIAAGLLGAVGVLSVIYTATPVDSGTFAVMMIVCTLLNVFGVVYVRSSNQSRRSSFLMVEDLLKAQEAQRRSEQTARTLLESSNTAAQLVTPHGRRLEINKEFEKFYTEDREYILRTSLYDGLTPERKTQYHDAIRQVVVTRKPLEIKEINAGSKWYDVRFHPIVMAGEPVREIAVYIDDITAIHDREERLKRALDEADSASRTKSEFLAHMSHELRTPLNAVIGFSEILEQQTFGPLGNEKYLEYSKDIRMSGRHLLDLINDILDLTKVEAGSYELREDSIVLDDMVGDAMRLVSKQAADRGVELTTHLPTPPLPLFLDERVFKQVLINLLSNAVKFTDPGGRVDVAAEVTPEKFCLKVTDTGIGMSPKGVETALEPFSQVDAGVGRAYEGTGLGLPLAQRLNELHGGELEVESTLGQGTTVSVCLPLRRVLDGPLNQDLPRQGA